MFNAITDVPGVTVGHVTCFEGDSIRTGVTAIVPHQGNIFRQKVPAAIYVGNGFGKIAGMTQVQELGNIETPVILTNTLSVAAGIEGAVRYTLMQPGCEYENSVNAVVGETNDGRLNKIRQMYITPEMVIDAIKNAHGGPVDQGNVGAGTGTICFGFKGGIGTSSRVLPESLGGYTIGVLVQTNYGGVLEIDGVQVGQQLEKYDFIDHLRRTENVDGSCMMVVITNAPLDSRNLERVAKRAMMGLAKTGGIASNGSGDYVIALSVAPRESPPSQKPHPSTLEPDDVALVEGGIGLEVIELRQVLEAYAKHLGDVPQCLGIVLYAVLVVRALCLVVLLVHIDDVAHLGLLIGTWARSL